MKRKVYFLGICLLIFIIFISIPALASFYRRGDRGNEVKEIQQMLADSGYQVNVDGIFGKQTERAVKDFQYNKGLIVDGFAGERTIQLLKDLTNQQQYTVKQGDTLSAIALKFGSNIESIKKANNLNSDRIYVGQELKIVVDGVGGGSRQTARMTNISHYVQSGDSLHKLARKYGTDVETIKLANNLSSDRIFVGQTLAIPHLSNSQGNFELKKGSLIWPVLGRISSPFGWRTHPISNNRDFHTGIDIAVPTGTRIRAAASGNVVQSGWYGGYGKTIIIEHKTGVKTLYAHNSSLLVSEGTYIQVGEVIARAGSTGYSTGPHLHFELLIDGEAVNPMRYLP